MAVGLGLSPSPLKLVTNVRTRPATYTPRAQQQAAVAATRQDRFRSGAVRTVTTETAASALESDGYKLLDIRPVWEWDKAHVRGSIHVPLYVEDLNMDPITLVKKWVHFGYIGLWTGQKFTAINERFLQQVDDAVEDKEAKLLVACGEGLRSMIALKKLNKGGYRNLGWLAGGFNRSKGDDFTDVEGTTKLQYATVGGVSYLFFRILVLLQVLDQDK